MYCCTKHFRSTDIKRPAKEQGKYYNHVYDIKRKVGKSDQICDPSEEHLAERECLADHYMYTMQPSKGAQQPAYPISQDLEENGNQKALSP